MGITFVEKGGDRRRPNAKIALVLAGGAISGGAFKIGGLIALDTLFTNRSVTDFDIFVGSSAGAFLAAPLAAGVGPDELLRSIGGRSSIIRQFSPLDFYRPNWREFLHKPALLGRDAAGLVPAVMRTALRAAGSNRSLLLQRAREFIEAPSWATAEQLVLPLMQDLARYSALQSGLSYLPSGLFDNRGIERFIRSNFERNGLPNDFRLLKLERGTDLYIGATNLDTAQAAIFGHDEDCGATISEAVQASTAIPGFYRPPRINGNDYLDAGVRKTANISLAVGKGAQLIIAYNPFRPYVNYHTDQLLYDQRSLSDMGIITVINQAFRTLLHTRLQIGIEKLRLDQSFHGDVVLLEPSEDDLAFFHINPLAFWRRAESALYGFVGVQAAIERSFERIERILGRYGIQIDIERLRHATAEIRRHGGAHASILDVLEGDAHPNRPAGLRPRRQPLRVVGGQPGARATR
jgi:predicted acylesterase/phospholipase RssA